MRRLSPTKSLDKNKRLLTQCSNNCDLQANLGLNASKLNKLVCTLRSKSDCNKSFRPLLIGRSDQENVRVCEYKGVCVCVCEVKRVKWDFCTKMMKLTWLFNVMHHNLHTEKNDQCGIPMLSVNCSRVTFTIFTF